MNAASGDGSSGEETFYTPEDLAAYSKPWGITLHYRGTLNTYRIEAHRPNGEVAGYTTGFYFGDLLHLDKVQVCACPCVALVWSLFSSLHVCFLSCTRRRGRDLSSKTFGGAADVVLQTLTKSACSVSSPAQICIVR